MSAADLLLDEIVLDVIEIAALSSGERGLRGAIRDVVGTEPPEPGRAAVLSGTDGIAAIMALAPRRWVMLLPPEAPGAGEARLAAAIAPHGVATDLSSGFAAFRLAGPGWRERLQPLCRLDLDEAAFPTLAVAATMMAQCLVTLARTGPDTLLLLVPSSYARHLAGSLGVHHAV